MNSSSLTIQNAHQNPKPITTLSYPHLPNSHHLSTSHITHLPHLRSFLFLLLLLPLALLLWHSNQPIQHDSHRRVEDDERPEDAEVSPSMAIRTAHSTKELVGAAERTIITRAHCIWLSEISHCILDIIFHIGTASHTSGSLELA